MANERQVVREAAQRHGIAPPLLWGVYGTETSFGKNVSRSSAGAEGSFQFMPGTARSLGIDPHNFQQAADGAARYLAQFKGRGVAGMLSAYNAGPAGGLQHDYVSKVLANAKSWGSETSSATPGGAARGQSGAQGAATPGSGPILSTQALPASGDPVAMGQLLDAIKATSGPGIMAAGAAPARPAFAAGPTLPKGAQAPAPLRPVKSSSPDLVALAEAALGGQPNPESTVKAGTPGTPGQLPQASPQANTKLAGILSEANHIAAAKQPYLWGGGHAGKVLPGTKVTPLDCSGAVSAALGINPKVSGEFEGWGAPGKGQHVTIYANSKHVLMEVDGRFWGTSGTNPGGGAGWIKPGVIGGDYLKAFAARHPAGL